MAFNGHQRDDETTDEDETPTKHPRSAKEMPGCFRSDPNNEAAAAAERATFDRRTSNSTARIRSDSVKKTRPRKVFSLLGLCVGGFSVFTGNGATQIKRRSPHKRQAVKKIQNFKRKCSNGAHISL